MDTLQTLNLGTNIRICQLNIEGISQAKCCYLSKLACDNNFDVIVLQETHVKDDYNMSIRGMIPGFDLIASVHSPIHGLATYIKHDILDLTVVEVQQHNDVTFITILINGINITNVYKPPNIIWPNPPLPTYEEPTIYVGDFNSHNEMWGYNVNDVNGEILSDWMTTNNLNLIYSSDDRGTFFSARWQREYTPDLCIVSNNASDMVRRHVMSSFPHSQHRPVVIDYGLQIPIIRGLPRPRWNFSKADWVGYSTYLDNVVQYIEPCVNMCDRFVNAVITAAKKYVPRGYRTDYIPGWTHKCDELYNQYIEMPTIDVANDLINELNKNKNSDFF